jgi:thioredoxin-dependent peroxiredoxin
MARIGVGDAAPGFTLPGTDGSPEGHRPVALEDFRGRPVVLVFYPGDDTPVCTRQLNAYSEGIEGFADLGAQVLAISPQSLDSHDRFAAGQGGFAFPLLSDPDKEVGAAYGILGPLGFYRRSIFVVDPEGIVRYAHRALTGATYKATDQLVEAVRGSA